MANKRQRSKRHTRRREHQPTHHGGGPPAEAALTDARTALAAASLEERLAVLEQLYAEVPSPNCKGLCWRSCGYIGLGMIERHNLDQRGIPLPQLNEAPCRHLDFAGRCSIYDSRPLVCRLYGATPQLACEYGCKPTISDEHGHTLMQAMFALEPNTPEIEEEIQRDMREVSPRFATPGEQRARGWM